MSDVVTPPFSPRCLYIGPWNPARHDLVTCKVVETEAAYRQALADGWRRRPDREDGDEPPAPEPLQTQATVSQEPKRRGPGRPRRDA